MQPDSGLYQNITITEIEEEVPGFKTIRFHHQQLSYHSGQYLTLVRFDGREEIRRSYSIVSSPALDEPLAIGVKRVENGAFSRHLIDHAKPGDALLTTGSGGLFVLPATINTYQQIFLFAAGSGITPVFSLLKTILYTQLQLQVVLVYSNATREKAVYLAQLQALRDQFPSRFVLELLFSNAQDLSRARLHRDLIFYYLESLAVTSPGKQLFFVCGPETYMRLCVYTLQEAGILPEQIRRENFYSSKAVQRDVAPPDHHDYRAVIRHKNSVMDVAVPYPNTILRAAKRQGFSLPYSCEAGRCGNCVALCVQGRVWHSYNEVLTEKELQKGLVLTCVGHPIGGDVLLEY